MMYSRILLGLGVSALALPALADVTPSDVWTLQQKVFVDSGLDIAVGSQSNTARALTLNDVTVGSTFDDDLGGSFTFSAALDQIVYSANGDGTVSVALPETIVATFSGDGPDGEGSGTFRVDLTDRVAVVAGDPDDFTATWSIGMMRGTLGDVMADGEDLDVNASFVMSGGSGTNRLIDGEFVRQISNTLAQSLSFAVDATAPPSEPEDGAFKIAYDLENLSFQFDGVAFDGNSDVPFGQLLSEGVTLALAGTYRGMSFSAEAQENDIPVFAMDGSATSGGVDFTMDEDGLSYGGNANGVQATIRSQDIPLPQVDLAYETAEFALQMPLIPSDQAQEFGLRLRLGDLTVNDMIWAMVDPMQQLPRDPATLEIDISGTGDLAVDLTDPDAMGPGQMPGQVDTLAINALELAIAGARLTGSGAFNMDNSGVGPFAPAPTPVGSVDMMLVGGNRLLDKLIAMGLLPEDQAMGFRMMLGLFARPGQGEDTLVSTIEVTAEGAVLANGQRIR